MALKNFLDICKLADSLTGLQGQVSNVETAVGMANTLVQCVATSFFDIQVMRENWNFMLRTTRFQAAPSTNEYTTFDIFVKGSTVYLEMLDDLEMLDSLELTGADEEVEFGRWQQDWQDTSYYATGSNGSKDPLKYIRYYEYRHRFRNSTDTGPPRYITSNEQNGFIYLHPTPDKAYSIDADYYVKEQLLSDNDDVPIIPYRFWPFLAYLGAEKFLNLVGNIAVESKYAHINAKLMGSLLRAECPTQGRVNPTPLVF